MILLVMANDEVLASTTKDSHGAMRDNTNPVYIHRPMMPRPIVHKLSSHEFFEVSVLKVRAANNFPAGAGQIVRSNLFLLGHIPFLGGQTSITSYRFKSAPFPPST